MGKVVTATGNESLRLLVRKIAAGNREAESSLVSIYRENLINMLYGLTADRYRAEDFAHEAFIVVLTKLRRDELKDPSKLSSYIYQTAKFIYFGWLRRFDNRVELRDVVDDLEISEICLEGEYFRSEQSELLQTSIAEMRVERDREVLLRRYVHEQTQSEICDALLLSVKHYNRVVSRARGRLKVNMEGSANSILA